ncbi:hypothetical protein BASA60_006353 [Batrachochytrium salamandrivorans]|nr:hypothetical protein BASA60_006353 [Batrachochytrium salamandrivorans]
MISPFVVAVALAAFPIMSLADKPNPADYPKPDALAPANPAWLGTVLQGVPALPVGTKPLAATDWSKDVTVCPNANQWGLTYDDGPGPLTDDLLGELAKRNVKATFFVVGSRVMAVPRCAGQDIPGWPSDWYSHMESSISQQYTE